MKKYINKSINQGGFALVATIAILALVVMVALAMVSLATSTTTTETHTRALDEARANARLALAEAISTLQRTTGPDTRVTASAKILVSGDPEDIESQNPDHPISLSDDDQENTKLLIHQEKVVMLDLSNGSFQTQAQEICLTP